MIYNADSLTKLCEIPRQSTKAAVNRRIVSTLTFCDERGRVFVAAIYAEHGISIYDASRRILIKHYPPLPSQSVILSVVHIPKYSQIWYGESAGYIVVLMYSHGDIRFVNRLQLFHPVQCMVNVDSGEVWVGGDMSVTLVDILGLSCKVTLRSSQDVTRLLHIPESGCVWALSGRGHLTVWSTRTCEEVRSLGSLWEESGLFADEEGEREVVESVALPVPPTHGLLVSFSSGHVRSYDVNSNVKVQNLRETSNSPIRWIVPLNDGRESTEHFLTCSSHRFTLWMRRPNAQKKILNRSKAMNELLKNPYPNPQSLSLSLFHSLSHTLSLCVFSTLFLTLFSVLSASEDIGAIVVCVESIVIGFMTIRDAYFEVTPSPSSDCLFCFYQPPSDVSSRSSSLSQTLFNLSIFIFSF
jgi:hypothetical protein